MPNNHRLPTDVQHALAAIRQVVLGFDCYKFWIDHALPDLPVAEIKRHCTRFEIHANCSRPYQPLWKSYIEIFQPDDRGSQLLASAIQQGRYRTQPVYAEIALDQITANRMDADAVRNFILAHLLVPHMRHDVVCENGTTFYYSPRAGKNGEKVPLVPALYSDRESKLASQYAGRRCAHLEYRYTGSEVLSTIGIACMADIAAFSHDNFWRQHLTLARLPSKTKLGCFLLPDKSRCTGTALRKRANKFLEPFHVEGQFVLQNVRRAHPDLDKILIPLDHAIVLDKLNK